MNLRPIKSFMMLINQSDFPSTRWTGIPQFMSLDRFCVRHYLELGPELQVSGTPLLWFTSYLENRMQYVEIENTVSNSLRIQCGVPQGSTLGPLLFQPRSQALPFAPSLALYEMPNCLTKAKIRIFADDSTLFYSFLELTINEFQHLRNYCTTNKLSINIKN
jgi:hypothetical protein